MPPLEMKTVAALVLFFFFRVGSVSSSRMGLPAAPGREEKFCGVDVYVNWPVGATHAVVLGPDIYGYAKPQTREFADKVAAAGFVALIPDYFNGDAFNSTDLSLLPEWLARHPFAGATDTTLKIIKGLKAEGIKLVGVAGFCYGGKVGVLLAKEGAVDALVLLHPSMVTVDDIKFVKVPLEILAAAEDTDTPVSLIIEYRQYLESQDKIKYFVKIFPDVGHGWTISYNETDTKTKKAAFEARSDAIKWFKKYLKCTSF